MILRGLSHNNTETPRQESIKIISNLLHIFFLKLPSPAKVCFGWEASDRDNFISVRKLKKRKRIQELCVFGRSQKVGRRFLPVSTTRTCPSCSVKCNTYCVLMTVNDFLYQAFTLPADTPSCRSLAFVSRKCCCAVLRQRTSSENGWLILKGRNKKGRQMFRLFAYSISNV